ncbi:hypothetical protein OF83DRAFT_1198664, partial [Amylostereum chailletii]
APVGSAKSVPQVDGGGEDIEMISRPKGWTDAKVQRQKGKQKVIPAEDVIQIPSSPPTPRPSPGPSAPIHPRKCPGSPNVPPVVSALDSKKPQIDDLRRISWALTAEELSSKPVSIFHPVKFGEGSSRGEQMGWAQEAGEQRWCPPDNLPNIVGLAQRHYPAEETHDLKAWMDFVKHFAPDPDNVCLPECSIQLLDPRRAALAMTVLAEGAATAKDFEAWERLDEGYRVEVETLRRIREEVLSMGFVLRFAADRTRAGTGECEFWWGPILDFEQQPHDFVFLLFINRQLCLVLLEDLCKASRLFSFEKDPWVTKYIASLVWDVHIYSGDILAVEVFDPGCIGTLGRPHIGGRHAWVHVYWRPTQRPVVVGDLVGRGRPDIEESPMTGCRASVDYTRVTQPAQSAHARCADPGLLTSVNEDALYEKRREDRTRRPLSVGWCRTGAMLGEHIVAASTKLTVVDKLLADNIPCGELVLIFSISWKTSCISAESNMDVWTGGRAEHDEL